MTAVETGLQSRWPGERVVFSESGKAGIERYDEAAPSAGEILVEARATLISAGTEKSCLTGRANWVTLPHYPGYSHAGVVRAVGDGVSDFTVGMRLYSQLPHGQFGRLSAGGMQPSAGQTASFNTTDTAAVIPEGVADDEAAFTTLAAVSLYSIRRAGIVPGERVVVVGLGIVGQLIVQLARLSGAYPVIGIDIVETRRSLAETLGADETLDPKTTAWADTVQEKWGGADVVFETAGVASLLRECVKAAKVRGRVVVVSTIYESVELDFFPGLDEKDVSLVGCHQPNNPMTSNVVYPWTQKQDRELLLGFMDSGRLQVRPLMSHRFHVSEVPEAYRLLMDPNEAKMGILLDWRDQT